MGIRQLEKVVGMRTNLQSVEHRTQSALTICVNTILSGFLFSRKSSRRRLISLRWEVRVRALITQDVPYQSMPCLCHSHIKNIRGFRCRYLQVKMWWKRPIYGHENWKPDAFLTLVKTTLRSAEGMTTHHSTVVESAAWTSSDYSGLWNNFLWPCINLH